MIVTGIGDDGNPKAIKLSEEQLNSLKGNPLQALLSRLQNSLDEWKYYREQPVEYARFADCEFDKSLMVLSSVIAYIQEGAVSDHDKAEFQNFLNYLKGQAS